MAPSQTTNLRRSNPGFPARVSLDLDREMRAAVGRLAVESESRLSVTLRAILAEVLGDPKTRARVVEAARELSSGDRRLVRHW